MRAVNAQKLQSILGNLIYTHYKALIEKQEHLNCLVTVTNIEAAEDIFGPSIKCLKGKTTRKKVKQVKTGIIPLPIQVLLRYQRVTLATDVMRVNGIRFFVSFSRQLNFVTAQHI